MFIAEDDSLMRCQLPMGHKGPHQEACETECYGKVTTSFEKGSVPVQVERLKHMIPEGDICWFEDGRKCQFLALTDRLEGERPEFACYLSGDNLSKDIFTRLRPSEYCKGCN
jgi:hypothetical protein